MSLSTIHAYGGSSGSSSDGEGSVHKIKCIRGKKKENGLENKETGTYFINEDSNSSTDEETDEDHDLDIKPNQSKLPKIDFLFNDEKPSEIFSSSNISHRLGSTSVFKNPFLDAEKAEMQILEHHVKMTEQNINFMDGKNASKKCRKKSKQICIMFKKGRCKFAHDQCRFSHVIGENLMGRLNPGDPEVAVQEPQLAIYHGTAVRYNQREEIMDPDDQSLKRRKKRVGVTNQLEPPKKAIELFDKQRNMEAPWLFDRT